MRIKHTQPKIDDTRSVRKFLWLPLTIGNETRWFETTTWTERYTNIPESDRMWIPIYWGNVQCAHGHENWDDCPDCCH